MIHLEKLFNEILSQLKGESKKHKRLKISPKNIYDIYKKFNIITNIYRIQHINSNLCGLFSILFCLYKVNNKNKFIEFLILFNVNDYIKNELV